MSTHTHIPPLSKERITENLRTDCIGRHLLLFDQVDSTNTAAKKRVEQNLLNGEVVLAREQTAGKGRLGRTWASSKGKTISMSVVLSPSPAFKKPYLLTQLTAAALSNALSSFVDTTIKWPNDVLVNNKKVAGILTETLYSGSELEAVIIGVGINVNQEKEDFSEDIQKKASSLRLETNQMTDPNAIVVSFLNEFEKMYSLYSETQQAASFLTVCRERSAVIGKEVWVLRGEKKEKARVQTIGDDGELRVIYEMSAHEEPLYSGEVSIRGMDGYV